MINLPIVMGASNALVKDESPGELCAEYNNILSLDLSTPARIKEFMKGSKRMPKFCRSLYGCNSEDERRLRKINWDNLYMCKALVEATEREQKWDFLFVLYVVFPLYYIIDHSRDYTGIYDYVNIVKSLKTVTPIEFSSRDVYTLLNSYRKKKRMRNDRCYQSDVDKLLCYYYPERAVYEKLKTLLDDEKEYEFCEVLANCEDENIYKHCHYYKNVCDMFDRVCSRDDYQPILRLDTHCIMSILERLGEYFYLVYDDFVMDLLLDVESIIKPAGLAADFQRLLDIPVVAELYAKAKAYEHYDSKDDDTVVAVEIIDAEVVEDITPVDVFPADPPPAIPDNLNTPEAKAIFNKAIEKGYMKIEDGRYIWLKFDTHLAHFTARMSDHLNLGHGVCNNKKKISWKPIEILFNKKNLSISYIQATDTSISYDELDNFFKELT